MFRVGFRSLRLIKLLVLAQRGCKVVMAGRSMERLKAAEIELKQQVPNVQSLVFTVDLADFDSVSRFVEDK
jgi:short-subunit dehydrogenase